MKQCYLLTTTLAVLLLSSCFPKLSYMGDTYEPTEIVELYFDEIDIESDFKIIGIARQEIGLNKLETIQEAMLGKAKKVGADAILFIGISQEIDSCSETVESKFLKYK